MSKSDSRPDHHHFVIFAAMGKSPIGFTDSTTVDVVASSESEALGKAKKLAPGRAHYFVSSIIEHHGH
jgi:hypothetical protein